MLTISCGFLFPVPISVKCEWMFSLQSKNVPFIDVDLCFLEDNLIFAFLGDAQFEPQEKKNKKRVTRLIRVFVSELRIAKVVQSSFSITVFARRQA